MTHSFPTRRSSDLSAARPKRLAALPSVAGDSARRIAGSFHLDPVDWYRRAHVPAHLSLVAAAVWEQRRIAVIYESWKGERRRSVDPDRKSTRLNSSH